MPYIPPHEREHLRKLRYNLPILPSVGELNYIVTLVMDEYLGETPNYERLNAAIGVLECAKQELYRRVVAPYEDTKIAENGDVYTPRG